MSLAQPDGAPPDGVTFDPKLLPQLDPANIDTLQPGDLLNLKNIDIKPAGVGIAVVIGGGPGVPIDPAIFGPKVDKELTPSEGAKIFWKWMNTWIELW